MEAEQQAGHDGRQPDDDRDASNIGCSLLSYGCDAWMLRPYHRRAAEAERGSWLLVSVSTAGAPASLRVHAWRRLRGLGALYLQQSVCLLPLTVSTEREIARLLDKVRHGGGQARVLHLTISDPGEQGILVGELQAAVDQEYEEVLQRLPSFFAELAQETARGRATYAEVEESEADLERFRSWVAKIEARDYFCADRGQDARTELARAGTALETFETLAMARDDPTAAQHTSGASPSTNITLRAIATPDSPS